MLATDILQAYLDQHPYGVAASTEAQLRSTWRVYLRSCRSSGLEAFDCARANDWLDSLRETHKPDTVRTQRGNLLAVWWWAYREQLIDEPPLRLRRLRPISRSPEAWTLEEVHTLVAVADAASIWWGSIVRVGYDTAARLGDLLRLRVADVAGDVISWRQGKTGRLTRARIRPETRDKLEVQCRGLPPESVIWPLWGRREAFYRRFRRLVEAAGIRRGTFRWLRRAAATQMERIAPGRGTELLGHRSRTTTEQWYIDRGQLSAAPLPPW